MKEIFELYEITKSGQVFSKRSNKELKGSKDKDGYILVRPRVDGRKYQLRVHRLVAMKYINNPNNLPQVNHINGVKDDNRVENLEWTTAKANIHHAWNMKISDNKHLEIPINQIDAKTGEILKTFDSIRKASEETKISETNISAVIRQYKPHNRPKPRQTAGGFKWERATTSRKAYTQASGNGEYSKE